MSNELAERVLPKSGAERVWRREFAVAADTASATRRWLRSSLSEHVVKEQAETAAVLVEEIVTASVRRSLATSSITVLLRLEAERVRVDVIDAQADGASTPAQGMREPARGLIMVGRNARSWGMTLGPPARIWFAV